MSVKIYWPKSQQCIGCKHGCLLTKESESSVYVCNKGLASPQKCCHEPNVSNVEDLDDDLLKEKLEVFEERIKQELSIDEDDLKVLKEEINKRKGEK